MRKRFVAMALVMMNVFGCMAGEAEEGDVAEADQAVVAGSCSVTCAIGDPVTIDDCNGKGICTANQAEGYVSCLGRGKPYFDITFYCPQPGEVPVTPGETSTSP